MLAAGRGASTRLLLELAHLRLTTSRRLYGAFGAELGLRAFPCPVPLPGLKVYASWHERVHRDTAHAWFRAQLIETQT